MLSISRFVSLPSGQIVADGKKIRPQRLHRVESGSEALGFTILQADGEKVNVEFSRSEKYNGSHLWDEYTPVLQDAPRASFSCAVILAV